MVRLSFVFSHFYLVVLFAGKGQFTAELLTVQNYWIQEVIINIPKSTLSKSLSRFSDVIFYQVLTESRSASKNFLDTAEEDRVKVNTMNS